MKTRVESVEQYLAIGKSKKTFMHVIDIVKRYKVQFPINRIYKIYLNLIFVGKVLG